MRPYPRPSPSAPGSAVLWRYRWRKTVAAHGEEHPASQAALGRVYGLTLAVVPQRNAESPAAIAWHRASEAQPGYCNRSARKHRREST